MPLDQRDGLDDRRVQRAGPQDFQATILLQTDEQRQAARQLRRQVNSFNRLARKSPPHDTRCHEQFLS